VTSLADERYPPKRPGEVQEELNIEPQASYILSIRNPEKPAPPGAGLPERQEADYPKSLEKEFGGRRFATEDPRLLDYEGAEFVLVGARTDPERAYDIDIDAEHETAQKAVRAHSSGADYARARISAYTPSPAGRTAGSVRSPRVLVS
jgi:hypothetical protein